jgi:hypothetical protein
MAGVDGSPREVEHVDRPQLGEQEFVKTLPDSGLVPVSKSSPARHPGAEAQLLRKKPPRDNGVQDKQNPRENLSIVQSSSTRVTVSALDDRQQRLDPCP